jgi:hypothetical protein
MSEQIEMTEVWDAVKTISAAAWKTAANIYGEVEEGYPADVRAENVKAGFEIWWDAQGMP